MKTNTIVFIHGMYMTPLCWEGWTGAFQAKGYQCQAPAWPGRDKSIDTLRKNYPDPELGKLTLSAILDDLTAFIRKLGEKPILVGHSVGGLVVQLLIQRDLAAAGIAVDPASPQGVLTTRWSFLKANWPHINPFANQSQPIWMAFERFQYAFVNTLPLKDQREAYERYVVPESRRVPAQSLTGVAHVDFGKAHAPLLMIAGAADHIIPAPLVKTNYNLYRHSSSTTDFKEFPGRDHFIIGEKNWEEVVNYVASWITEKGV